MQKYKKLAYISAAVIIALTIAGAAKDPGKHPERSEVVTAASCPAAEYAGIEEYRVQAFETLSDIAVKYIPSDEYMQQWIEDVKRLNNRRSDTVYYDEVIKVYVCKK